MFSFRGLKVFLATLCIGISSAAVADQATYRFGVEDVSYYPLYDFVGEQRGILPEIVRAFVETEHLSAEFVPLPIHRFTSWYQDRHIDFRLPDSPIWTAQVNPNLTYSDPIIVLCEATVVLAKNQGMRPEQFTSLGTLLGFTPSQKWHQSMRESKITINADPSIKLLTRMLLNEMVDGLDLDISTIQHELRQMGLPAEQVAIANHASEGILSYRMSTQEHPEIITKFNHFLRTEQKLISDIINRHIDGRTGQCQPTYPSADKLLVR